MQTVMTTRPIDSSHTPPEPASSLVPTAKLPGIFAGKAWQQVLARDSSADGQFVYAVRSTHIFCRPSCPSRRPSRKNVTFFPSPTAAETAGYRACKRCEPNLAAPRSDPHAQALATVTRYLKEHAAERTTLKEVALATGVPRLTILRGFKRVLGVTPAQFAREQRLASFKDRLKPAAQPRATRVTDAIYDAGFGSSSRLYEASSATLGMTPTDLKNGAAALTIHYAIADSPLGRTLVAATPVGICAIAFGHSDAVLRHDLRDRFPKANLVEERFAAGVAEAAAAAKDPQAGWLAEAVHFVLAQLSEHPAAARFPMDVRATAFQHRVWEALRQIPRGETRTYTQIAQTLGQPTAARAVASACGANPVALAIPCHRVVGAKGSLTGYRWGVERKQTILSAEAQGSPTSA
jgi:AraC family transcriptional regulator of adaptative response/methylated-DNA-[protein]-cysteine methyltransferase